MLNTRVIDPIKLSDTERQIFLEMATWRYASHLDPDNDHPCTVIALYDGDQPKGLCIIDLSRTYLLCEIKHYVISPELDRSEGVQKLISHAVELTKEANLPLAAMKYEINSENEALDRYLEASGWTKSRPWLKQYLFDVKLFRPKWMDRKIPIPDDCSIITWSDLNDKHKHSMKMTIHGGGVPLYLTPFYWEEYRQEFNTLFLLKEERVIGWCVTHTFPDRLDTVQYTSLFIHPLFRHHGYSIRLLVDSIRLLIEAGVDYGVFTLSLHESSKSWKRFIERNLEPNSQRVTTTVRRDYLF